MFDLTEPPVTDAHVHVNRFDLMRPACRSLIAQNPGFAVMERLVEDPALLVDHLDQEGIQQVWCINYCARDVMGYGWGVNDWAAQYVAHDRQRIKSTGGYDPRVDGDGQDAARGLRERRLIGAKIHPVHQHLSPDAHTGPDEAGRRLAAFYQQMQAQRDPVWFHTGTSVFPGADNSFASVAPVERVAVDHPRLQVVLCHGGRPNECNEAVEMMRRRLNVWMDVSSMPPKRIAQWFGDFHDVADRVLWGSDWPGPKVPGMGANVLEFLRLGMFAGPIARMILADNAARLLATRDA